MGQELKFSAYTLTGAHLLTSASRSLDFVYILTCGYSSALLCLVRGSALPRLPLQSMERGRQL